MFIPSGTNITPIKNQSDGLNDISKQKRKKRRVHKEKLTSLSVVSIKRLLVIEMNAFGGREQELVQLAKHKMIEVRKYFLY